MARFLSVCTLLLLIGLSPAAGGRYRFRGVSRYSESAASHLHYDPAQESGEAVDALDEVNQMRRDQGLRPFARDDNYTTAAMRIARFRSTHLLAIHTANDFAGLPPGTVWPRAGGAGASYGSFNACCTDEAYGYAGAAKVRGRDGQWYCQIFVR